MLFNYNARENFFEEDDKEYFVKNLGILLHQTREGIKECELSEDGETVLIRFNKGGEVKANIACDSWMAIIKDVIRAIDKG